MGHFSIFIFQVSDICASPKKATFHFSTSDFQRFHFSIFIFPISFFQNVNEFSLSGGGGASGVPMAPVSRPGVSSSSGVRRRVGAEGTWRFYVVHMIKILWSCSPWRFRFDTRRRCVQMFIVDKNVLPSRKKIILCGMKVITVASVVIGSLTYKTCLESFPRFIVELGEYE